MEIPSFSLYGHPDWLSLWGLTWTRQDISYTRRIFYGYTNRTDLVKIKSKQQNWSWKYSWQILSNNRDAEFSNNETKGAFHLMAWPIRPKFFSLYQWKDVVYVSQISSENDRSEDQMFCVSFNNLTGLAVLMESAPSNCYQATCLKIKDAKSWLILYYFN